MQEIPYAGPEMVPDHSKVNYSDIPPIPNGVKLPDPKYSVELDEAETDGHC